MRTTGCLQTTNQIILKTLSSGHWALVSGNWDHISPLLTHSSGPVSLWRLSLEFLNFYMDRYKLLEPAWVGGGDVQRSLVSSEQSDEVVREDPGPAVQRPLPPAGVLQLLGHHRHHLHQPQLTWTNERRGLWSRDPLSTNQSSPGRAGGPARRCWPPCRGTRPRTSPRLDSDMREAGRRGGSFYTDLLPYLEIVASTIVGVNHNFALLGKYWVVHW